MELWALQLDLGVSMLAWILIESLQNPNKLELFSFL
jgi:hypothetical protein